MLREQNYFAAISHFCQTPQVVSPCLCFLSFFFHLIPERFLQRRCSSNLAFGRGSIEQDSSQDSSKAKLSATSVSVERLPLEHLGIWQLWILKRSSGFFFFCGLEIIFATFCIRRSMPSPFWACCISHAKKRRKKKGKKKK